MDKDSLLTSIQQLTTRSQQQKSKEQKQFQELLGKIQLLKEQIEEKKVLASKVSQLKNEFVMPLVNQLRDVKLVQLRALDWAYERNFLSKRLKVRLRDEILERLNDMLNTFAFEPEHEEEIMTIAARHSGARVEDLHEERKESEQEATREYLRSHYGIELEDDESADLNDPEVLEKIKAKIAEENQTQNRQGRRATESGRNEHKVKAIQDKLSKSIRSVYTSLVKHLHPDKEMDETQKAIKTEAIKEVTKAYEAKDMLSLLILQTKYGIIDAALDDSDLRSYNAVLKKQLAALEHEHLSIIQTTRGVPIHSESALEKFFKSEKNNLKKHIQHEKSMLQGVFENEDVLTEYLKQGY